MLKNKRIDPRDPETPEWGKQISETKTCVEFEELPGRYGIRTSQIFNDAEIDVFVGEYETPLDRITSGNPSETEFYASGGMAYIIVNAAHDGEDIRADYYPGGSVLTAEVLDSEDFKGPQGDTGPQGPTGPAGAPGDVSNVENVGAGVGVFKDISAGTARFKSLVAGANIDLDTTDPDEIGIAVDASNLVGDAITALAAKTTPVDADSALIKDSEASDAPKWVTFTNLKAFFKTYFDTLYDPINSGGVWRAHTAGGVGSAAMKILYFNTVVTNSPSSKFTIMNNDSTNGLAIKINTAGLFAVSLWFDPSGGDYSGISLNASSLTTSIISIAAAERLSVQYSNGAYHTAATSVTLRLAVNDVIRPHVHVGTVGTAAASGFVITYLGA
ncbi:MAG: collagen-like protein [Desulfurellales bacterium]|nr:MAG: collagen-like protein [Desulfurellales bacterium]